VITAKYGTDPVLVNGKYFENLYRNDLGHPYYITDQFFKGYIIIHQKKIENIQLKYNIFDQTLVVAYNNDNAPLIFIPPNEFITGFSINGNTFRKFTFSEEMPGFYQDIFVGDALKIVCGWTKKRYDSYHNKTYKANKFSDGQKKYFVVLNNVHYEPKSNKDFVKIFAEEYQQDIALYMKDKKIKLAKSDSKELEDLGAYTERLLFGNENK
jgi:hypothetical protein